MKTIAVIFCTVYIFGMLSVDGQVKAINNNITSAFTQGTSHQLFKFSIISSIKKGTSVGISYGMWLEGPALQYSLNTGCMWRIGKGFLGNYRNGAVPHDSRTKGQLVFMFSPMLTAKLSRQDYVYQELESFYLGNPNAVFCKYRSSITLGSTFSISPRGSYKNVATVRNRAQQDFILGLNFKDFNFTLYDDYFPFFTDKLQLGDNWDRFFTGGGFLRYRFSNELTMHIYSEVYTGINRSNPFLYPDVISYKKKKARWYKKNFASQDPEQEYFNSSWFIVQVSYTSPQTVGNNPGVYVPDMNVFIGTSASWTVFSQNAIHSAIHYDDPNELRLHYFLPRTNVPGNLEAGGHNKFQSIRNSMFVGGGLSYNILKF